MSGSLIRTLTNHTGSLSRSIDILNTLSGGQQQSRLVSGSYDQTIKVWDIQSGQLLKSIETGLTITHLSITTGK